MTDLLIGWNWLGEKFQFFVERNWRDKLFPFPREPPAPTLKPPPLQAGSNLWRSILVVEVIVTQVFSISRL